MSPVAIVLPVYEPDLKFFQLQLESIKRQSHIDFQCIVGYDGPPNDSYRAYIEEWPIDARFLFVEFPENVGVYRHVERLLMALDGSVERVFLCDQDDEWDFNRIESQLAVFDSLNVTLVSDNARLIDERGSRISESTLFRWLGVTKESPSYGLLANCVTGAGTVFTFEVARKSLPFPKDLGCAFHDHWIFLVARNMGRCVLRPTETWSYRQHSGNVIGVFAKSTAQTRGGLVLSKAVSIMSSRINGGPDVYLDQIVEYERVLSTRFLSLQTDRFGPSVNRGVLQRLALLRPRHLIRSRLETFRVFLWP
jgi:glycosyltransferase involved in cell wall biosynthesis